ncbi:hypothetical protein THAOC_02810 [Thalassiosira oceanica]|uniref:Uncharacterized protein n=1 Tax=Thalassiosira oceanica TaxID=159749 RepID=K0TLN5_THAOC|nr:hypothetical protein THAOC_02810 [Thalassiosira oceanica]|eukprot:EJK75466.1 hypothetical protein THAOC_02810 [Thalassiosira oceanica]
MTIAMATVDERMQSILDQDRSQGSRLRSFLVRRSSEPNLLAHSSNDELLEGFQTRRASDDHDDDPSDESGGGRERRMHGVLRLVNSSCVPPRLMLRMDKNGRPRLAFVPAVLSLLVFYGFSSLLVDLVSSLRGLANSRKRQISAARVDKFPGHFHSNGVVTPTTRSVTLKTSQQLTSRHSDSLTAHDVPRFTRQVLATTFGNALSHEEPKWDNEIAVFWSIGATPGRGPAGRLPLEIANCYPNVVQAGTGGDAMAVHEEEIRLHPNEVRMVSLLDHAVYKLFCTDTIIENMKIQTLVNENNSTRAGMKYINVDLFTAEGVIHASDLHVLFPAGVYPTVLENRYKYSTMSAARHSLQQQPTDIDGQVDPVLAANQINFINTAFLPEIMGLFDPPTSQSSTPLPKARIHALLMPANSRIMQYFNYYRGQHLEGMTLLDFVTSSHTMANNFVTRVLSGQFEEGDEVTEAHLEVAKNVASQKVRFWPMRDKKGMIRTWSMSYGWDRGARAYYNQLNRKERGWGRLVLGMNCMFPPPSAEEEEAAASAVPVAQQPQSDLQVEINRIISERNKLDQALFNYVVKLDAQWTAEEDSMP